MKKEVTIYSFINNGREILEIIDQVTGKPRYILNKHNIPVNKHKPLKFQAMIDVNNNITEIKEWEYMSIDEVKKALDEMDKDFPDIF